jgi:hypothetical protein
MQHKPTDKLWKDEAGMEIPVTRVRASEKLKERMSSSLLKKATTIRELLVELKELANSATNDVNSAILKENGIAKKDSKGNFTWYNFDRSIKIEVSVNERIEFDETLIALCKSKLDEFIDANLNGVDAFVKSLINDAFQNTKGKLDSKKVMSLLKHRSKIKDQRYQDAMEFLEKSIRRPDSKTYFRIWEKNAEGEYKNIDLNFSSI